MTTENAPLIDLHRSLSVQALAQLLSYLRGIQSMVLGVYYASAPPTAGNAWALYHHVSDVVTWLEQQHTSLAAMANDINLATATACTPQATETRANDDQPPLIH